MSRQLNLRVSDEFANRLESYARKIGRPMAAVLESVGTPALETAEADQAFEAEALAAWEEYQLTGISVPAVKIDKMFSDATKHAKAVRKRHGK
jgi:predicted transcriptional regulator